MKEPVYYFNTCDSFIKNGGGDKFYDYLNSLISLACLTHTKDSIPNSETAEKLYKLAEAASNNEEKNLAMAAAGYVGRKYEDYIYYIEGFIKDITKSSTITSDIAFKYVLRFFNNVNIEDKLSDTIKGLEKIAEKYCKGSAFQLFIDALKAFAAGKPAETKLKKVLLADSNWYLAEWLLGSLCTEQEGDEIAVEHYIRSYEICKKAGFNPEECFDAHYYCETAGAYYFAKQLSEAEKNFKKCLEIDEEHPQAKELLMCSLVEQKKYTEAEKFFNSIKDTSKSPAVFSAVSYMYGAQRNYEDAEKYIRICLDNDPEFPDADGLLIHYLAEREKYDEVFAYCDERKDKSSSPLFYYNAACIYSSKRKYNEAVEFAEKCLELNHEFAFANNNLGYYLLMLGRLEEALEYFEKAMGLREGSPYPYRNKFDTLIRLKRYEEALKFGEENISQFNIRYLQKLEFLRNGYYDTLEDMLLKETPNYYAASITVSGKQSNIALYDHQEKVIGEIPEKDSFAGLLVLPTGAGKTITACYWLMKNVLNKGGKVVWLADRQILLNQTADAFEKVCYGNIADEGKVFKRRMISGIHDRPVNIDKDDDFLISITDSLRPDKGLKFFVNNWLKPNSDKVVLVIDEAHHAAAAEYTNIINIVKEHTDSFKMLGLTATPYRTNREEQAALENLFPDGIIGDVSLAELISKGILAVPCFKYVNTEGMPQEQINEIIVKHYIENKKEYGQTIVFAKSVDDAIEIDRLFNETGEVKSMCAASKFNNSDAVGNAFRLKKTDVVVNYDIFTEGADFPEAKTVFIARPTTNKRLMIQMVGRALRGTQSGGTEKAYIVTFADKNNTDLILPHELCTDSNLCECKPESPVKSEKNKPLAEAPVIEYESIDYTKLDMGEICLRNHDLWLWLTDEVYQKYYKDGYYYSALSGFKSKNRNDFEIDHIKPRKEGGLTRLDNLQLLTKDENRRKSDKYEEKP